MLTADAFIPLYVDKEPQDKNVIKQDSHKKRQPQRITKHETRDTRHKTKMKTETETDPRKDRGETKHSIKLKEGPLPPKTNKQTNKQTTASPSHKDKSNMDKTRTEQKKETTTTHGTMTKTTIRLREC